MVLGKNSDQNFIDFLLNGHLVDIEEANGDDVGTNEGDDSGEPDVVDFVGIGVHELDEARKRLMLICWIHFFTC